MGITQQLRPEAGALWNKGAAIVEQQAINKLPPGQSGACSKLLAEVLSCGVLLQLSTQRVVVGEEGPDSTKAAASSSRRDSASATVLNLPARYSTVRSYPNNLETHVCCGMVVRRWSRRNLRLQWSVRMVKA